MIRPALSDEAPALTQIALDAKRYWGYPEHWIKHWESDLTITPEFIADNQVFVLEGDGQIRGFYALCINENNAELEHLWVTPQFIGTGIGKELFLDAMNRATTLSVNEVQITAEPNAAGFYEKMGAKKIGEANTTVDGQPRSLPRMKVDLG